MMINSGQDKEPEMYVNIFSTVLSLGLNYSK